MSIKCEICDQASSGTKKYRDIAGVPFHECLGCGSLFADFKFLESSVSTEKVTYDDAYWRMETSAARARSFGSSLSRCAEVFFYSRIPVDIFLDIGTGPGFFLDAVSKLMPQWQAMFYGVELFPPPAQYQTKHQNYVIGDLTSLPKKVSAGMCIEVIEHLHPNQLSEMLAKLALMSEPNATFLFNSGQPDYVKKEDPGYLDPLVRGHIVSYSTAGVQSIFAKHGFTVIPLPGRAWAFLAQYTANAEIPNAEQLLTRVWQILPENAEKLKVNGFGELMYSIGQESARCYIEAALVIERTKWALSMRSQL